MKKVKLIVSMVLIISMFLGVLGCVARSDRDRRNDDDDDDSSSRLFDKIETEASSTAETEASSTAETEASSTAETEASSTAETEAYSLDNVMRITDEVFFSTFENVTGVSRYDDDFEHFEGAEIEYYVGNRWNYVQYIYYSSLSNEVRYDFYEFENEEEAYNYFFERYNHASNYDEYGASYYSMLTATQGYIVVNDLNIFENGANYNGVAYGVEYYYDNYYIRIVTYDESDVEEINALLDAFGFPY